MTERVRIRFVAKAPASEAGTPWIAFEPLGEGMEMMKAGVMGFDLKPGTMPEQARRLADVLDEAVASLNFTIIPEWLKHRE